MILIRHKEWMNFINELATYTQKTGGNLYQPAYHPDLLDVPFVYGEKRYEIIKNSISSGKTLLDIGANFGYFCHKFSKVGFMCTAVEINPQDVYFMKKLKDINNDKFKIAQSSIFEFQKDEKIQFDTVLALNIFHHFLKREPEYNRLKEFLSRLECNEMFFETHDHKEDQMESAYKNFKSQEFVNFILSNSCLNNYYLLYEFKDGRKLYRLY